MLTDYSHPSTPHPVSSYAFLSSLSSMSTSPIQAAGPFYDPQEGNGTPGNREKNIFLAFVF